MCAGAGVLALCSPRCLSSVSVCSCMREHVATWIHPRGQEQLCPPERPRSCSVRGLWGSGWCARSCASPGWWSSALPLPETPARSPAPGRPLPGAAVASDPARLTRTCKQHHISSVTTSPKYEIQRTKHWWLGCGHFAAFTVIVLYMLTVPLVSWYGKKVHENTGTFTHSADSEKH